MLNWSTIMVPGKRFFLSAVLTVVLLSFFSAETYSQWFFTIEAKAGRGGEIDPSGKVLVWRNSDKTFEITPDSDKEIKEVKVDGEEIEPVTSYTFENVTANHKIEVSFQDRRYIITATAGPGGEISPDGEVEVKHDDDEEFKFEPYSGYEIQDVLVDGISIGPVEKYKFNDVTSNHTIHVIFRSLLGILNLSIPNVSMKIGDVVVATLTVYPPTGALFSLVSGTVGGYPLVDFQRVSETTYTASFTVDQGGNSYAASENIPVSELIISGGGQVSIPYNLPIVQDSDPIDAALPLIYNMRVSEGINGIGDEVQLTIETDGSNYTLHAGSTVNGIAVTEPNISFSESGGGNYLLSYTIQEGDNDVDPDVSELEATITLVKPSGNMGSPYSTIENASLLFIDAHAPVVTNMQVPSVEVGVGLIVRLQVSADGTGYSAGIGSVINGIPVSSPRVTFTGLSDNLYELSYVVGSEDAAVAPGMLEASLVLMDAAGNMGDPYSTIETNSLEIYTDLPIAALAGPLQICEGEVVELSVFLTGRSPLSFDLYDGTSTTSFSDVTSGNLKIEDTPVQTTTYQINSVTDVNGVVSTSSPSHTITVNEKTEVEIINLALGYHWEDDPVRLEASIPGGIFSGPGVISSTGYFYPDLADTLSSPHTIVYTYENDLGCQSVASEQVYVMGSGSTIVIHNSRICINGDPFLAVVLNLPGVTGSFRLLDSSDEPVEGIADNGDNTATIDPSLLTLDSYTIEFQYENGTTQILRKLFTVESVAQPLILNLNETTYCQSIIPFVLQSNLENVVFEGPGVTRNNNNGYTFNPREVTPGSIEISCTYTSDIGCTSSTRKSVEILGAPEVRFEVTTACTEEGGEIATFDNQTPDQSTIVSWNWNFGDPASGDNNQSNLVSPTHHYLESGLYTISLAASTGEGCVSSSESNTIISSQPVADFTWLSDCFIPESAVKFINRSTSGTALLDSILWTFKTRDGNVLDQIRSEAVFDTVSYAFATADSFLVDLYTVSTGGCSNQITKEIILSPSIPLGSEGYLEDFNESEGLWTIRSMDQAESWVWGVPDFEGYTPEPEDKAWYTDLPDGITGYLENSWIQSPCLDLSDIDRPMIRMDLMKSFVPEIEGAVLQYRDVVEEGWKTVGENASGIGWYNMENIEQKPGGSNIGWGLDEFIPDGEWIPAMHDLDQVAGKSDVIFRIALATSGRKGLGNQGFAFDNIAIRSRTKLVVLEHFTNCSDDISALADDLIDDLKRTHSKDVIDLQYHMDYEDQDPMNLNNPDPPTARSFNFGVPTVPYSVLEGGSDTHHRYDYSDLVTGFMEDELRLLSLESPAFDVDLVVDWQETGLEASVAVTCNIDRYDEYIQLYLVVFESEVTAYTGSNGDTHFRNVVLDMLPTAAGDLLEATWRKGTSENLMHAWNYKHYVEDIDDLAVVAFIQERNSKKIIQAAVEYKTIPVGKDHPVYESKDLNIYPNPANTQITIETGVSELYTLNITSLNGQQVFSVEMEGPTHQLDLSSFQKGIYFITIRSKDFVTTKKIIKL